jgi:hypothetical protein
MPGTRTAPKAAQSFLHVYRLVGCLQGLRGLDHSNREIPRLIALGDRSIAAGGVVGGDGVSMGEESWCRHYATKAAASPAEGAQR